MATGGFINGNHSVHQSMLIKGPSLIWEGKFVCWMTLATLIKLPSSSLASSNSFQITAKPENYIVPRILEIRGIIASLTGVNKVNIFYQWDQFGVSKSPDSLSLSLQCERGWFPDLMSSTGATGLPPGAP